MGKSTGRMEGRCPRGGLPPLRPRARPRLSPRSRSAMSTPTPSLSAGLLPPRTRTPWVRQSETPEPDPNLASAGFSSAFLCCLNAVCLCEPGRGDKDPAPVQFHGRRSGEERALPRPGHLLPCCRRQRHVAELLRGRRHHPARA